MPTTPVYALPYPSATDTADVPRDIQALAAKLDAMTSLARPPVVTTLPGGAVDGQEVYFVADAANGVVWHLRYRTAATGAYKWEYVGGSRLRGYAPGPNAWTSPASFAWQACPGGPALTIPLAGEYAIEWNAALTPAAAIADVRLRVANFGGNIPSGGGTHAANGVVNPKGGGIVTYTAGGSCALEISTVNATFLMTLYDRTLWAQPVRVG